MMEVSFSIEGEIAVLHAEGSESNIAGNHIIFIVDGEWIQIGIFWCPEMGLINLTADSLVAFRFHLLLPIKVLDDHLIDLPLTFDLNVPATLLHVGPYHETSDIGGGDFLKPDRLPDSTLGCVKDTFWMERLFSADDGLAVVGIDCLDDEFILFGKHVGDIEAEGEIPSAVPSYFFGVAPDRALVIHRFKVEQDPSVSAKWWIGEMSAIGKDIL
jgi:hypothetical protein